MRCTTLVHQLAAPVIKPGSVAVDATAGNGHDTVFLARSVGPDGRVFAFDIQPEALETTSRRLMEHGLEQRVTLHLASHEEMDRLLPASCQEGIAAFLFNFGFLPGGCKRAITRAPASLKALQVAAGWVMPGGLIAGVLYPGHEGGSDESEAVCAWAAALDARRFDSMEIRLSNRRAGAPMVVAVWKRCPAGKKTANPGRNPGPAEPDLLD